MSFFSKIVENKGIALAIGVGVAALGLAVLYKNYQNEDSQTEAERVNDEADLQKQLKALRSQINTSNPSLDDIKQILTFSMNYTKKKIHNYSLEFKRKRQEYNSQKRKQNMKDYMNLVSNGMQEVRNIATNTQSQIMKQLGLNESVFMKYQTQLQQFMGELMMSQGASNQTKQLTLEEVKYAIRLQIQYLKKQGQQILQNILEVTKNWPAAKKSQLPLLLSVVIADGAFEDHPQIDEEAVQAAQMKMQRHLMTQLQQLQMAMTPIMRKLSTQLGGFGGAGMGMDMGMGMGMDMGMQQDPFGGITMEQMEQLRQLQQLRLSDPEAFQKMMGSMYG